MVTQAATEKDKAAHLPSSKSHSTAAGHLVPAMFWRFLALNVPTLFAHRSRSPSLHLSLSRRTDP